MSERWRMEFSSKGSFDAYCKMISERFCPYLKPAEQQKVLYATRYTIIGNTLAEVQEDIFYRAVLHTEQLRHYRRKQPDIGKKLLACENVLFHIPQEFNNKAAYLMGWAHWLLKILYTQVNIMVGKFWTYEQSQSRKGMAIPPPPCHFLSIRSAIKTSDPYFFEGDDLLLKELMDSVDNAQNVHQNLLPTGCDIHSFSSMKEHGYYQIVYEWAEKEQERGVGNGSKHH